jgi:hypothetical protein
LFLDYFLLEYAAASLGSRFPTFRVYVLPSPSRVLLKNIDPSRSRLYVPSKCRDLISRWSSDMSQNNVIESNIPLKTGQPEALGHTSRSTRQTVSHRYDFHSASSFPGKQKCISLVNCYAISWYGVN